MTHEQSPKTVHDLMQVTGLGRESVKAGIRTGELPGHKVGSRYVVPHEAFTAFCEGRWTPNPRPYFREAVKPITAIRRRAS